MVVAVIPTADAVFVPPFELPPPQAAASMAATRSVPHDLERCRIEEESMFTLHNVSE
jgi:hypothetical protein